MVIPTTAGRFQSVLSSSNPRSLPCPTSHKTVGSSSSRRGEEERKAGQTKQPTVQKLGRHNSLQPLKTLCFLVIAPGQGMIPRQRR